ncbi:MAG: hypothetical protein WCA39_02785 [Nitrososphaeraceae archaeon]|jgi:hypothetical protein
MRDQETDKHKGNIVEIMLKVFLSISQKEVHVVLENGVEIKLLILCDR